MQEVQFMSMVIPVPSGSGSIDKVALSANKLHILSLNFSKLNMGDLLPSSKVSSAY